MLNIVGSGMGGRPDVEQNTKDMDPERTAEVARRHKDVVVGIKVAHYAGPEWIAVDRGVEAGKLAGHSRHGGLRHLPPERPFQELVLKHLRPGDIYTHQYLSAVPMLDANGRLCPICLRRASAASSSTWATAAAAFRGARRFRPSGRASHPIPSPPICTSTA